ncbi:MAG: hypothetical protein GEU28_12960 [Dehalococcoidia bacterium]|nr:hypothetical protein [Dehalococcoidia bacterium]
MKYVDSTHIALRFTDLRAAESYYRELFDLDVAWRDTKGTASMFATWEEIDAAGVQPWITALHCDNLRLTIETGGGSEPRASLGLDHVGLHVSQDQLRRVQERAAALGLDVKTETERFFIFHDRYGLKWELDTHSHADIVAMGRELEERHRNRQQPA